MTFQVVSAYYVGAAQLQGDLLSCLAVLLGALAPTRGLPVLCWGHGG